MLLEWLARDAPHGHSTPRFAARGASARVAELNPIIRQAIFDTVVMIEQMDDPDTAEHLSWLIRTVPDYWEIPNAGCRIDARDEGSEGEKDESVSSSPRAGL